MSVLKFRAGRGAILVLAGVAIPAAQPSSAQRANAPAFNAERPGSLVASYIVDRLAGE